jgi:peptidoglycan/LPS O-acetylase OafA/YrhL
VGCGVYLSTYGHGPRVLSIGVAFVASVAAIVLVAALFERWVDQPAIRFGKWLLGRGRQDAMAADRAP